MGLWRPEHIGVYVYWNIIVVDGLAIQCNFSSYGVVDGIIGPYFFEDENGATVTVSTERYIHMLNTFLRPQMKRQRVHNMQNVYFQQDGATPHTARLSMDVVRRMFPGRVFSRFRDIPWPPRSPDLTTCDFFCGDTSNHMSILTNIAPCPIWRRQSGRMWQQLIVMLECVYADFQRRLENCIQESGHHLPDIIFHS